MASKETSISDETKKLLDRIAELEAENIALKAEINNKPMHTVTTKGWYNGNKPNSVLSVDDKEYADMKTAGIIY